MIHDNEIPMKIRVDDIHMANCEMLIQILALQNVIIEILITKDKMFTPEEINKLSDIQNKRYRDNIYTEYGSTPDIEPKP
jgi:hypothetical protein